MVARIVSKETEDSMSDLQYVLPIVYVVAFWIVTGILACWFFGRALRVPTEAELELEAAHEHKAPKQGAKKAAH
jgi:hypothetical protein